MQMLNNCDIKTVVDLLGMTPSSKSKYELRFGKRGSLSVNLKSDVWFDHEHMTGGGILDLVVREGKATNKAAAAKFLQDNGLTPANENRREGKPILREHIYR